MLNFSRTESRILIILAVFGFLVPNGIFCYYFFTSPEVSRVALGNPIALVFMLEAFFLMFLFAWLLYRVRSRQPSGTLFIVLSIIGSMAFSVPISLYLMSRDHEEA